MIPDLTDKENTYIIINGILKNVIENENKEYINIIQLIDVENCKIDVIKDLLDFMNERL